MTIAVSHIIAFEETEAPLSGTESHVVDLMKGLARAGVQVELIAIIRRDAPRLEAIFTELDRHNIVVKRVAIGQSAKPWDLTKLFYKICKARPERIIHTHLPLASFYGRIGGILARCIGVVETQHNDNPADGVGWRRMKWQILDIFTHRTIAISENVASFLTNIVGLDARKVEIVHYGIKPPEVLMPRETARERLGIAPGAFCVGFVGKLTRQKNIPLLFDAVKDLPNVTLCLIGGGEEEEYLKKRAHESGVDNVIFAGGMDFAADYMTAFNLMVLPSRWEGLGLVLLEAMIRHVPVAGSMHGAIPETLGHGKRGFLFNNASELRTVIQEMMADSFHAADKEVAAYQDVLAEYTVQAMVDKTRRIYYGVAAEPLL